ncbi:MAG: type II secretion system protein [Planctomycetes bacterium]|nr:type II secretion system protein [Planctomycetota bacterium]
MRKARKGFTLTEILVAMAIFALGGSAIVALFITNQRLSRQAMDSTRAAEITRNVRSLLTQSLSRPIQVGDKTVYKFDYPGSSLTFLPNKFMKDYEQGSYAKEIPTDLGGTPVENAVFFRLPAAMFQAGTTGEEALRPMLTSLPNDSMDSAGNPRSWENGRPEAFRLLPDSLRRASALYGLDPDDRMFYSFDFSIRRSLARSGVEDPANPGFKLPLEDLFVVHVKVYKGFEYAEEAGEEVQNTPYYETDFYIAVAR